MVGGSDLAVAAFPERVAEFGLLDLAGTGSGQFVDEVDQVSFSGARAREQEQDVTYVTERCVIRLIDGELVVTEIAPELDLQKDVLDQAGTALKVSDNLKTMDARLFHADVMQLELTKP